MDCTWQQFFATKIKEVQLCCTLYHWFLQMVAVGGLCVPANECSKGGVPFATGKLSNSSTNNVHPQLGHLQTGFFVLCLIGVLGDYLKTLGPKSYPAHFRTTASSVSQAISITSTDHNSNTIKASVRLLYSPNIKSVDWSCVPDKFSDYSYFS